MPEPTIPDGLVRYLAKQDKKHADAVLDTLAALTPREERLVREVAVQGYVRGQLRCRCASCRRQPFPRDTEILAEVVDACLAYPEQYPTVAGLREGGADG